MIRARPAGPPPARRPSEAIPKLPPLPGSRDYQRIEARKQLEQDKKLRELVLAHQVPVDIGATVFYFMTRKGKLRRLTLTDPQAKQLETGALAVVERPDPGQIEHALVPAEAAEQIFQVSERAVRFFNRQGSPIGFMSDDELKSQQEREARAEFAREERLAKQTAEGASSPSDAASPDASAKTGSADANEGAADANEGAAESAAVAAVESAGEGEPSGEKQP